MDELSTLHDLAARVQVAVEPLGQPEMIRMTVSWDGGTAEFVLDDEYGDGRPDRPALCLALLRHSLNTMSDELNADQWARAINWHAPSEQIQQAWTANAASEQAFADALGPLPDLIAPMDWELNAGLAQALRR